MENSGLEVVARETNKDGMEKRRAQRTRWRWVGRKRSGVG